MKLRPCAKPYRQNCGTNHMAVMFTTPLWLSKNPSFIASFLLFFSTNVATILAKHEITNPIPIRCFTVSTRSLGSNGSKIRSYKTTHRVKVTNINAAKLVGGISIFNTTLFMVSA
ncbi:hypothetical protein VIGAN_01027700 [Vigna angularis var. angularis]|uniref:Uncharacterized protein n=1 Tax=Vigna angularis var. angularis TaxID=157739 RepID=A0A0S3QWZ2_PHAAN|nr:hypothetical protein VIGAN_01027700 [Vigna angularis var. angularis]